MSYIQWREDLQVGITAIDEQHQQLFAKFSRLDEVIEQEKETNELPVILDKLVAYLKEHFSCEESLLKGHPKWPEHHNQHWQFTEHVLKFLWAFKGATASEQRRLAHEIRNFLYQWLQQHIIHTDRQYFKDIAKE